ncbi:MAG: AAA domain-containing protein [Candidatus Zixiibacteriota bacterium]
MDLAIIREFIQALDEEIAAIKKGQGGSFIRIFNGRFLREVSGLFVYVFHLENFLAVLDEAPAEIEIRGHRYQARVLVARGLEVEIGIEQNCSQFIPEAVLNTNLWYLLKLLRDKYAEVVNGNLKSDFRLGEFLFSSRRESERSGEAGARDHGSRSPAIDPQQRAAESSVGSKLCIIWGPPGTGKTRTIAKAVEAHLHLGRRVLLVSHANNAVDEALCDVAKHLNGSELYEEGKLVRLGTPGSSLSERFPLVRPENIARHQGQPLIEERAALQEEMVRIDETLHELEPVMVSFGARRNRVKVLSVPDLSWLRRLRNRI